MPAGKPQKTYRFADLTLDTGRLRLYRGSTRISLSTRLLRLLQALVEGAPNVVDRDELSDRVWGPRRVVTPENIAQHVTQLRRALEDDATQPRYIESVRGEGYRLIPDVRTGSDESGRFRNFIPVAAAMLAIILAAFIAGQYVGKPELASPSIEGPVGSATSIDTDAPIDLQSDDEFFGLPGTTNRDAYERYVLALGLLDRAGGITSLQRAEELLREAIAIDPEFMAARGLLARTLGSLRYWQPDNADDLIAEWNEIIEYLARAMPENRVIHIGRALQLANANDWASAERILITAIATVPPGRIKEEAQALLVGIRQVVGRYSDALPEIQESSRRDPLSLQNSILLQSTLYTLGDVEQAEDEYRRSLDLLGDRAYVENLALMRAVVEHDTDREISERLERLESAIDGRITIVSELVKHLDDRDKALWLLRRELDSGKAWPLTIAWWADYHGDTDLALTSIRKYFEDTSRVVSTLWSPFLSKTRKSDGFGDIARDFGLLDYWQETGNWGDFCQPVGDSDFRCE